MKRFLWTNAQQLAKWIQVSEIYIYISGNILPEKGEYINYVNKEFK